MKAMLKNTSRALLSVHLCRLPAEQQKHTVITFASLHSRNVTPQHVHGPTTVQDTTATHQTGG
jgi:hypothetical protein